MYSRWQTGNIIQALRKRRVVLLCGARQSGKTTLCRLLNEDEVIYRTLDDLAYLEAAINDPQGFVKRDNKTLIIDEIQRAPNLLLSIKQAVDVDNAPGQYLVTGSADIQSLPTVRESLAGRVRKIFLSTLTVGEINGEKPLFLDQAFTNSFQNKSYDFDRDSVLTAAFKGGYPEPLNFSDEDRQEWHRDYIDAIVERDLRDISNIYKLDAMKNLIPILAAWSSKLMDVSAIGSQLSLQRQTLESYIQALETLYIIEKVQPWTKTDYDRAGKQKKLFMADPGLMSSILGWDFEKVRFDSDRSGKLVETFIFHELSAQIKFEKEKYRLFHYRDRLKREIDFLIERNDGAVVGVEVKSGSAVSKNDFKHLKWFSENMIKDQEFTGIVFYTGMNILSFGKNLWAVPIGILKG